MKLTFAEHTSYITSGMDYSMMGEQPRKALEYLCSLFPYGVATEFGFESRLNSHNATCDFFLLIHKSSQGSAMIAGDHPVSNISRQLSDLPFWKMLRLLFREWNNSDSLLHRHIQTIWLEFDYQDNAFNLVPNLFFQVCEEENPHQNKKWDHTMERTLDQIYQILFGTGFPSDIADSMRRCVKALPPGAILFQTGFMVPRKDEAVRLVLSRLKYPDLARYLEQIGWTGDLSGLYRIHSRYLSKFLYSFYDLDIGKNILPRFGTELFFMYGKQPQWESAWHDVFDLLQSDRFLTKKKREGLLNWCGKRTLRGLLPVTYYNGINHLKLVTYNGDPPECKGYFGTMIKT